MSTNPAEISQGTEERKVGIVQFAAQLIQQHLALSQQQFNYDNNIMQLLNHLSVNPDAANHLPSGHIDQLALIDERFVPYKR